MDPFFWDTLQSRQLGFGSRVASPESRCLGFYSFGHACRSVSSKRHRRSIGKLKAKTIRRNSKHQCGHVENCLKTSLNVVTPLASSPVGNVFNVYYKNAHIFVEIKEFLQFFYIVVSFFNSSLMFLLKHAVHVAHIACSTTRTRGPRD